MKATTNIRLQDESHFIFSWFGNRLSWGYMVKVVQLFLYCVMLPFSRFVAIITVHAVIKGIEKQLYWAETQTSSFFGWKIILVQRARRCYGVQHYWAPWLLHDTKTWTFTSGIFSSFPVGAKFIRSLSHRDEAVCPHRNHIMWQNKNTTVSIEWEPQKTLFCSPGIDWLLGVRQAH